MEQNSNQTVFLSVAVTPAHKAKLAQLAADTERSRSAVVRLLIEGATPNDLERRERAESRREDER